MNKDALDKLALKEAIEKAKSAQLRREKLELDLEKKRGGGRSREDDNTRKSQANKSARNIGYIPSCEPKDVVIKGRYMYDLKGFLQYTYPEKFYRPFSDDQETFIQDTQEAILKGGMEAIAMPRGDGKTTIIIGACTWAIAYGHRRYICIIGADAGASEKLIDGIKVCFDSNHQMIKLFPELCIPCKALEGLSQRATGQLYQPFKDDELTAEPTHIKWKNDHICLPQIVRDEKHIEKFMEFGIGAVIESRGLTGRLRGMQQTLANGEVIRPDFVFLDDPQTRESAKSPTQCNDREDLIKADVAGLAGIGKPLAMLMACTVICKNDLAERMLDEWRSVRAKALYEEPVNKELWDEYIELRKKAKKKGTEEKECNKFYKKHRKELDEGARVGNPHRKNDNELSALQHIYNYITDNGMGSFQSELQNEPLESTAVLYEINPNIILDSFNNYKRLEIPEDCHYVIGGCDVNYYALNWGLCAVKRDFTTYVIDYGQYPKGKVLWEAGRNETAEQAIYNGIIETYKQLCKRNPEMGEFLIDGNYATDTIYRAVAHINKNKTSWGLNCRAHVARGVSSHKYSLPNSTTNIVNQGYECHLSKTKSRGEHIIFNSHYWHMHLQKGFLIEHGYTGSVSLYGDQHTDHRVIANHICSEKLIDVEFKNGKEIYTWTDAKEHNDLSDAVTMALVGASIYGADVNAIDKPKKDAILKEEIVKRERVKHINL